ncbi:ankyrin repeat domain-containing protein (plasmid) [Alteromonas macleodii]|jgi:ankyrin repeat protein|uniref:ankyrin repeat domain-containing protein n=1 Tax=Alteromonas macleodii TaxID=28108 RepID=UPI000EDB91BF|nr:hypothetical protein [Pseudoalteromonas sp.]|tara:strand:+ start:527 stop:1219 length:693 start_codon:yes stop_codon:yes gene_type:complete
MITNEMKTAIEKYKGLYSESKINEDIDIVCILLRAGDEEEAWKFTERDVATIAQKFNEQNNTIATVAAWNNRVWFLKKLHENNIDLTHHNVSIFGARHLSVLNFLHSISKLDVNAKCDKGFNPLQQACNVSDNSPFFPAIDYDMETYRLPCVEFLLNNGADVNALNDFGRTAAMGAAHFGANRILHILLKHGADVSENLVCNNGKSTLDYTSNEETVELLKAYSQSQQYH